MSLLENYDNYDGLGLAKLVRNGEISAQDLVKHSIGLVEKVNPKINAICRTTFDKALENSGSVGADTPFCGVPFLVKDLTGHMAGVETNAGSRLLKGLVPRQDTELMVRYRKAGLIPIATTTTPEMGLQVTTESELTGATCNPWNTEHSAGGSSGGSAAAVAAGIAPIADASDGAGSIRIPASCCGLFGLKPTRQRTPSGPNAGDLFGGLGIEFPVTRTVRDAAALLDALSGADIGPPSVLPPPPRPFLEEVEADPGRLRIAFADTTFSGTPIDPECAGAVWSTAVLCEEMGHEVEDAMPQINFERYFSAVRTYFGTVGCTLLDLLGKKLGRTPSPGNLEAVTWNMYQEAKATSAFDFIGASLYFGRIQRLMGAFFERYDVLITSVLTKPPVKIGVLKDEEGDVERHWHNTIGDGYSPFSSPFNVTGQPAASVPLHWTKDGLPVGIHVITRFGDEATLLRLAAQLERARPWFNKRPPLISAVLTS